MTRIVQNDAKNFHRRCTRSVAPRALFIDRSCFKSAGPFNVKNSAVVKSWNREIVGPIEINRPRCTYWLRKPRGWLSKEVAKLARLSRLISRCRGAKRQKVQNQLGITLMNVVKAYNDKHHTLCRWMKFLFSWTSVQVQVQLRCFLIFNKDYVKSYWSKVYFSKEKVIRKFDTQGNYCFPWSYFSRLSTLSVLILSSLLLFDLQLLYSLLLLVVSSFLFLKIIITTKKI